MKKLGLIYILFQQLFCLACVFAADNPYRIAVVVDEFSKGSAKKLESKLRAESPFNKMGNELEIIEIQSSAEDLKCYRWTCSDRSEEEVCCDENHVLNLSASSGAHRVLIVQGHVYLGGGSTVLGSHIATVSNDSLSVAVHELMHSWGFADEYSYAFRRPVFKFYCKSGFMGVKAPNLVYIQPQASYRTNAEAKAKHKDDIPWFAKINEQTPIITGKALGTPKSYNANIGLYFSDGACSSKKLPAWKPLYGDNLMNSSFGHIPSYYAEILTHILEAERGQKFSFSEHSENSLVKNPQIETVAPVK